MKITLTGIIWDEEIPAAVLEISKIKKIVYEGDKFIDTKILTISQTEVTVSSNQQLVVLKLGQGTQF